MKINECMNNRIKKLDLYDIALIKWCIFSISLYLAKMWEPILSLDSSIYLILGIIFALRPMYDFYIKK